MKMLEQYTVEEIFGDSRLRELFLIQNHRSLEVLEKVKELLTFPSDSFVNIQKVAELYEVHEESISQLMMDFGQEILEDNCYEGKSNVLFSWRAMLRIGLLLNDSEIAEEVRSQLLNVERS